MPPKVRAAHVTESLLWGFLLYAVPAFVASFLLSIGVIIAFGSDQARATSWIEDAASAQFLYIVLTETLIIGGLFWLLRHLHETWRSIGVLARVRWNVLGYIAAGTLAYYAVYVVVILTASALFPIDLEQEQQLGFDKNVAGLDKLLVFAALVILPPVVEEIMFRGFLYTRLKRALSIKWAAVVVSIVFAAAHLQVGSGAALLWAAAIDTFVLSLVLVYLREKTGHIWASVGVHALKNFVAFTILFGLAF